MDHLTTRPPPTAVAQTGSPKSLLAVEMLPSEAPVSLTVKVGLLHTPPLGGGGH